MRRPGYTVVEVLLAGSIAAVLVGLGTVAVAGLLVTWQSSADMIDDLAQLERLATQFRSDVHRADSVVAELRDSPNGESKTDGAGNVHGLERITIQQLDETAVEYVFQGRLVERNENRKAGTPRREIYRLPKRWTVSYSETSTAEHVVCHLVLRVPARQQASDAAREIHIEAIRGLDFLRREVL